MNLPEVGGTGPANGLLAAFAPLTRGRARQVLAAYAIGTAVYGAGRSLWNSNQSRRSYKVTVRGDDEVYADVHAWFIDQIPAAKLRSLDVRTVTERGRGRVEPVDGTRRRRTADLRMFYDGGNSQICWIAGHKINVSVETPTMDGKRMAMLIDEGSSYARRGESVTFTATNAEGRDAVLALLRELAETRAKADRSPSFYMAARWGGWESQQDIQGRPLHTVVLPDGQLQGLVDDIEAFLAAEDDYVRLGAPYHRGYLFHGPPGTGKTSIARALATHFDLDVYFLALSDMEADTGILQTVAQVRSRSLLVIEDVDVVHAAQDRTSHDEDATTPKEMSLSGLLNALDGIATPHGLITVMTTNRIDVLDDALVRPGRIDRVEEIGYLQPRQLKALVKVLLGVELEDSRIYGHVTPAEVVELVKRNLGDPDAALEAIGQLCARTPVPA